MVQHNTQSGDESVCWKNLREGHPVPDDLRTCCLGKRSEGINSTLLFMPLFEEDTWPRSLRVTLYFIGILYVFVGISCAVDVFMSAIEKIITHKIKVKITDEPKLITNKFVVDINGVANGNTIALKDVQNGHHHHKEKHNNNNDSHSDGKARYKEVNLWNETVATLTLGALGTAAPEILLTIIEVCENGFEAGQLGPGTIIGSAAFNLLITTGICISAVPSGETRRVEQIQVYIVTTVFSILAYLWLIVILALNTPEKIELWEAALTLFFYVLLVGGAYIADKHCSCCSRSNKTHHESENGHAASANNVSTTVGDSSTASASRKSTRAIEKQGLRVMKNATAEELAQYTAQQIEASKPKSLTFYRTHYHELQGSERRMKRDGSRRFSSLTGQPTRYVASTAADINEAVLMGQDERVATVEFATSRYAVTEDDGKVDLVLVRSGNLMHEFSVQLETIEGTATENDDYWPLNETVHFRPTDTEKSVTVHIVKDDVLEPDEVFYVKAALVDPSDSLVRLGQSSLAEVWIVGDVKNTVLSFKEKRVIVKESIGVAQLRVERKGKVDDLITLEWSSQEGTAKAGTDYVNPHSSSPKPPGIGGGTLVFNVGEIEKTIDIEIINTITAGKNVSLRVFLQSAKAAADPEPVLIEQSLKICLLTLISDDDMIQKLAEADQLLHEEYGDSSWRSAWRRRFEQQLNVNDGDVANASSIDYLTHSVSFGWKLLFVLIPPAEVGGGYLTFILALAAIGLLTAIMKDFANQFGCLLEIPDVVTGAALLSVGSNLPDVFASRFAARQDKVADNAIGHIQGSNAVNVFFGLGIPWLMACIYRKVKTGDDLEVGISDLVVCVVVYSLLSMMCVCILLLRRNLKIFGKAELGGPKGAKYVTSICMLFTWLAYVVFTYLQSKYEWQIAAL